VRSTRQKASPFVFDHWCGWGSWKIGMLHCIACINSHSLSHIFTS